MIDPSGWRYWPLLLGAVVCIATSAAILAGVDQPEGKILAALTLLLLGSVLLGAFIFSEGANAPAKEKKDDSGTGPRSDSAGTGEHGVPPAARPEGLPPSVE